MNLSARRAATRDRILAAAFEVFAKRGVAAASVEEICEAAGFTRGAFYSNFESKTDLCVAILNIHLSVTVTAARGSVATLNKPTITEDELIEQAINGFIETVELIPGAVMLFNELRLMAVREPELKEAFDRQEKNFAPTYISMLNEGLNRYGYKLAVSNQDVLALLDAVYSHSITAQLRASGTIDRAETGRLMALVLRGLTEAIDPDKAGFNQELTG